MLRHARIRSPFRPQLLTLEDRCTPSSTAVQYGTGIYVTGDSGDNAIHVVDQDGAIIVSADGQQWRFIDADQLFIDTQRGNDDVSVELLDPSPHLDPIPHLTGVHVNLGDGDDNAVIAIIDVASERIDVNVLGGAGADKILHKSQQFQGSLAVNSDGGGGSDVMISEENGFQGDLLCVMNGGGGSDVMISDENGFQGNLAGVMKGGDGNDSIAARVGFNPQPDPPGSPSHFDIFAGAGDDDVAVSIPNDGDFSFHGDLGGGDDALNVTMGMPGRTDASTPERTGPVSWDVAAGAGDDQVNFNFFDIFRDTNIAVDLGRGNDAFQGTFDIADLGGIAPLQLDPGNFVALAVSGGAGNDTFGLQVGTELVGAPRDYLNSDLSASFDGGRGSDSAVIGIFNVAVNGTLTTALDMGAGGDRVSARTTGVDLNGDLTTNIMLGDGSDVMGWSNHDVAVNGTFVLNVQGGAGNDVLVGNWQPCVRPEGSYQINLAGDAGNDVIIAVIEPDADTLGPIDVRIQGGSGDDLLGLRAVGISDPGVFQGHADGGDGFDVALVSRGIDVRDCEVILIS